MVFLLNYCAAALALCRNTHFQASKVKRAALLRLVSLPFLLFPLIHKTGRGIFCIHLHKKSFDSEHFDCIISVAIARVRLFLFVKILMFEILSLLDIDVEVVSHSPHKQKRSYALHAKKWNRSAELHIKSWVPSTEVFCSSSQFQGVQILCPFKWWNWSGV